MDVWLKTLPDEWFRLMAALASKSESGFID